MNIQVTLIRHGKTAGNLEKRYIGSTDQALSEEGIRELKQRMESGLYRDPPDPERLVSSPMLRCLQTAGILYPGHTPEILPDLRECDFGLFEGHNHMELETDPRYVAWLASEGTGPFPQGEDPADFRIRVCSAFRKLAETCREDSSLTVICHGGTIMAILGGFSRPQKPFYQWQAGNGSGYRFRFDPAAGTAVDIVALEGE